MGAPMVTRVKLVLTIFYLQQQTTQTIMKFKHGDKVKIIQRKPGNTTGNQNYNQPNGDVGIICYLTGNRKPLELRENKNGTGNYYGLYGNLQSCYFQDDDLELVSTDFVLPEKWCIKQSAGRESCEWFNEKYGTCSNTRGGFTYLVNYADVEMSPYLDSIPDGYTEITFDQFKQYVLKDTMETTKEPKFEVGKWYKWIWKANGKITYGKISIVDTDCFNVSEGIHNNNYDKVNGYFFSSCENIELLTDLTEIQKYLPDDHPDKIKYMKTNEFKKGDYIVISYCDYPGYEGKLNYCYRLIDNDYRYAPLCKIPLDEPKRKKARYATPQEIDEYDRLGEPYDVNTLNVQQIPVDESLVGRYLKALRNNPRGVQVTTGNYVLITGSGCVKVENSKSTWACSVIQKGEFELMPEGFVPPTEPKAAVESPKQQDLIEEAKRRYPVGCKAKCFVTRKFYEITEDVTFRADPDGNVYSYLKGELYHNHRSDGNWAEVELPILGQVYLQATDPTENLLITKPMNEYTAEEALAELKRMGFKKGVKYVYMCADGTYNESDICTATRQPSIRCDGDYIDCGGGYLWSKENPTHLHRGPISTNPCAEIVIPKLEEGRSRYDWFEPPAFQSGTYYQAKHDHTPNYLDPASLLPKAKLPI